MTARRLLPWTALILALWFGAAPAWGDPPPLTPADVREIHDMGDFERLYKIARAQPRDQSSDAINRYRLNLLTPEFLGRLDELVTTTSPTPGLTPWLRDFQTVVTGIKAWSYDWSELHSRMCDLHDRYEAMKIPAS